MLRRLTDWFENGDLTPLAVVISVAHYGPVLHAHGEHWLVAWAVGALIDLLHFRSIRHFTRRLGWISGAVAVMTTVMASMYHLRFYSGDWLLALPIPVGIGILAWHAAERDGADRLRDELDAALAENDTAMARIDELMSEAGAASVERDAALAERDRAREERDRLRRKLDRGAVEIGALPPRLADYVQMVAAGTVPNGEFTDRHGVGKSTLDRANSMLLGG